MTTLSIKIPDGKVPDVAAYVQKMGGEVVKPAKTEFHTAANSAETAAEDEVTHESFFGENIKRVIRAFKS